MKNYLLKVAIFSFILVFCLSFTSLVFADTPEEDEYIYSLYEFTGGDAYLLTQPAVCYVSSIWYAYVYDPNTQDWSNEYYYGPFGGSGFVANPETGTIVTAGHMVDVPYVDLKWAVLDAYIFDEYPNDYYTLTDTDWNWIYDNYKVEGYNETEPDREVWVQFNTANSSVPDSPGDTFMRAEVIAFSPWDQRDIAILKVTPITGRALSSVLIGDSSTVSIQDKVTIIGYPWSSDIGQDNPLNPTVTTGSVSGKVMIAGTQVLQVQGDARPGNSGGPVLGEDGSVIGILTMGTDNTNNYLRPSNDIKALLGVENKLGLVDEQWQKGLIMFNNSHYSEALNYFDAILNLSAGHLFAQEYKAKAQSNMGSDVPYEFKTEEEVVVVEETVITETESATGEETSAVDHPEGEEEGGAFALGIGLIILLFVVIPIVFIVLIVIIIVVVVRKRRPVAAPATTGPAAAPKAESPKAKAEEKKAKSGGKFCPNCGSAVKDGEKFCSSCGNKM